MMSKEEVEAAERSSRTSLVDVDTSMQRMRSRVQGLNSWESVPGFASLGGLFGHALLAVKAKRLKFE